MSEINRETIRAMRLSYGQAGLADLDLDPDPIAQFKKWLGEAAENIMVVEANAMVLSTITDGAPIGRTVLLKDVSSDGFTFFTNYLSRKARAIAEVPKVSLLFPWYPMERQVIIVGSAEKVSAKESDDYFASRPWGSQVGAIASAQSEELESREVLERRYAEVAAKYPEGSAVPRPDYWGGYLVRPESVEFWQGRHSRLHDRLRYVRSDSQKIDWQVKRLNP
ncbi:MAG: pyridoxamine 5'-phosphate oxidase [Actinobacteria bacterium]|nr:pyridoxamine 5'-phosphate oxidase [Actinomycetota bacterium]